MTEAERKRIEKEIQGLKARLNWTHISEGVKQTYMLRIDVLKAKLEEP